MKKVSNRAKMRSKRGATDNDPIVVGNIVPIQLDHASVVLMTDKPGNWAKGVKKRFRFK